MRGKMRLRDLLAMTCVVAVFALPSGAQAVPQTQIAQCKGAATPGGGPATCSTTFTIDEPRDPQNIATHANFHALTAVGAVEMDWYDQSGLRVAHWECQAPGLFVHRATPFGPEVEGGPADAADVTCTSRVRGEAAYAHGAQRLVVTATAATCEAEDRRSCPFHGYLALKRAAEPV